MFGNMVVTTMLHLTKKVWKLFNSLPCSAVLHSYVAIAIHAIRRARIEILIKI